MRSKPLRRSPIRASSKATLRKAPTRKAKKPTRTSLRRKADRLWSKMIRERDGTCQAAGYVRVVAEVEYLEDGTWIVTKKTSSLVGCNGFLQAAHIVSRRYLSIRWAEDNGLALCAGHHSHFTGHPIEFEDWIIERIGKEEFRELRARGKVRLGPPAYELIIERLEGGKKE